MARKYLVLLWLAALLAFFLYFFRIDSGLFGPDEPRYAWIGRAMAETGDWITPRLWGQPWYEKPALLYWMSGSAFRLGLGDDLAPRLPVALLGTAFLVFYWRMLRREFGARAATLATITLGTSVGWIGYSSAGVPDLPLTAAYSAAMLLALPWIGKGDARYLPAVSAMLGVAALAKGLVPIALAAPLALRIDRIRDALRLRVLLPFFAIAAPWYALCYARNGWPFIEDFFVRHHLERFTSGALLHTRPWWFYLPTLPLLLLPWIPLLVLIAWRGQWNDSRRRFLALWALFGLALFSASTNKLPGYVLPLLPAIAALAGLALDEIRDARGWLIACAVLLVAFPIAAPVFAAAAANEWGSAPRIAFHWTWLAPAVPAAAAWMLEARGRRVAAATAIAVGVAVGVAYLKARSAPEVARVASARSLAAEIQRHPGQVCAGELKRDWDYGLHYYLREELPSCETHALPFRVVQQPGHPPALEPAASRTGTPTGPSSIDHR